MEGALPSVLSKLRGLIIEEYEMKKELKGQIQILQDQLESMHGTLKVVLDVPAEQLDDQAKIWATEVGKLSYDIEDGVDTFMTRLKANEPARHPDFLMFIDRSSDLLIKGMSTAHSIATDISLVKEESQRHDRYKVDDDIVSKPVTYIVERLLDQHKRRELIGIDQVRDKLINLMHRGDQVSEQHCKVVSIFGFGGIGKTTVAKAVYEKLRTEFDFCAFVSVSQNPDMKKLFKVMLNQLCKLNTTNTNEETFDESQTTDEIREFLQKKSYFIVVDDIWNVLVWKMIRCALPDNNCRYKIITTTRFVSVAVEADNFFMMRPLSHDESRRLLYTRIFGSEGSHDCLSADLTEVSDKILKKCGGLPLAIIRVANFLAGKGRNKLEWYEVYKSIGTRLENAITISSLVYYDLPTHLKSCLLYLSMFPQDYDIAKDRLVQLWIAEGFIQCGIQGRSLFELGESYYYNLVNRSMIEPVYKRWDDDMTEYCHVNNMVLDVICSLSSKENFVTILNNKYDTHPSGKAWRLSLQNSMVDHYRHPTTRSMQQVRSIIVFPSAVNLLPDLLSFRVLRVLDLQYCRLSQGFVLKDLGDLILLRYLGLRGTCIAHLPEDIGKLRFLQTLDVTGNGISSLPSTFVQLRDLMFLHIDSWTRVPKGIGGLTSLEHLSTLCIHDSTDIIEELGHITKLRVLGIECRSGWNIDSLEKSLVECLHKLQRIQSLSISIFGECSLDAWVAPRHLRRLELTGCWSSALSSWMNPSLLLDLSSLLIELRELQQEDLEILGRLTALRYLDVEANHENLGIHGRLVVGALSFPRLVQCVLRGSIEPVAFQQGAMPRLTGLCFTFPVLEMREAVDGNGSFDFGLGNLQSLQNVIVSFLSGGASEEEVEEAEAALRDAIKRHPNRPSLEIH